MHENVPVRFGRGRLDCLGDKGLAAYLIARCGFNANGHGTGARARRLTIAPVSAGERGPVQPIRAAWHLWGDGRFKASRFTSAGS